MKVLLLHFLRSQFVFLHWYDCYKQGMRFRKTFLLVLSEKGRSMEYNASSRSFQKPFRFQTSQQKRLFTNLRLLRPGPATFYREARSLMLSHQEFASVTHMVTHILREIESAVRRVLLPYNFAQPEECKTCGNRPEVHAKQIEAIVQSLELNDSVQENWKEIATRNKTYNGLAAFAHRENLSHPRKLDASFEELVSAFEDVFNLVLAAFEQQSMHVFALLDSLLKQDRPSKTKKHLSILRNKVPHNDATHRYFFERLQSPGWFDPLYQEGFFFLLRHECGTKTWISQSFLPGHQCPIYCACHRSNRHNTRSLPFCMMRSRPKIPLSDLLFSRSQKHSLLHLQQPSSRLSRMDAGPSNAVFRVQPDRRFHYPPHTR